MILAIRIWYLKFRLRFVNHAIREAMGDADYYAFADDTASEEVMLDYARELVDEKIKLAHKLNVLNFRKCKA